MLPGDRYQLQGIIHRGGMDSIYRALDTHKKRFVAIKVLYGIPYSSEQNFLTHFQKGMEAVSTLRHPNIVQVYDYGQAEGNYYVVMELVQGTDLLHYLRLKGELDVDRAVIIAHDIALGLGAAHDRGIVCRDIKQRHIFIGRGGSIKIVISGLRTIGLLSYYLPELAQSETVTPAADIYALGNFMYEMLTGRPTFEGDTPVEMAMQHIHDKPVPPSQYNPSISPALEEIILYCLEKAPEMRYQDGSQLVRALETLSEAK